MKHIIIFSKKISAILSESTVKTITHHMNEVRDNFYNDVYSLARVRFAKFGEFSDESWDGMILDVVNEATGTPQMPADPDGRWSLVLSFTMKDVAHPFLEILKVTVAEAFDEMSKIPQKS